MLTSCMCWSIISQAFAVVLASCDSEMDCSSFVLCLVFDCNSSVWQHLKVTVAVDMDNKKLCFFGCHGLIFFLLVCLHINKREKIKRDFESVLGPTISLDFDYYCCY